MNQADTAWMLVATALVLLMTPGLAFFYGGLVRSKNVLNTIMMSFVALGVIGLTWAFVGYSLAFGTGGQLVGDVSMSFLSGVGLEAEGSIPHMLFMAFQGTFAIITAALISGAIVERMRFSAWLVFIVLWSVLVYSPIAHWVWGGNVPFALLGAGLLWFGWFGFNAGSALAADETAALAFVTTMLAPGATLVVWTVLDAVRTGRPTAVGAATAIVVGLVAITPASGFVSPMSAIAIGAIAGVACYFVINWRANSGLDDSLDVVAAHGVGGTVGALLTGVFASDGGNVGVQAIAVLSTAIYCGVVTFVLLKLIGLVMPLRSSDESTGMDIDQHSEEAYLKLAGSGPGD